MLNKIEKAIAYVNKYADMILKENPLGDPINDAANIFADSYEEYNKIYDALIRSQEEKA